jgi:gamma-glutamyltranspeptidase/glutathione hydrolase
VSQLLSRINATRYILQITIVAATVLAASTLSCSLWPYRARPQGTASIPDGGQGDVFGASPTQWSEAELNKYWALNAAYGESSSRTVPDGPLIASTSGALAIHIGAKTLRLGGTAADAAIATALSQITLVGGSWSSFAGMLYALYYEAESGKVYALNAGFNTIRDETEPESIPSAPTPSGRTALVGGFMAGVEQINKRFGKLPMKTLFEPAISLAENGVPIDAFMAKIIAAKKDVLLRTPEGEAIFSGGEGKVLGQGDMLRQPELAVTLRNVAEQGSRYMYAGPWGRKFVGAVRAEGGLVTLDDLEAYETSWEMPLTTNYNGYEVNTISYPEVGAVQLLEGLNLLELASAGGRGHYSEDPQALFRFIQLARLGYVITYASTYRPDPGETAPVPWVSPQSRIGKETAKSLWERLQSDNWEMELHMELNAAGTQGGGDGEADEETPGADGEGLSDHSDGIVVVDGRGNVAVLIHSINTSLWGSTGIFVDGVSVPDPASFQQGMTAKAGPGKRFPNVVNPAIVTRDGKPVLAAGAIGNALHECMLQHLSNILDYNMDPLSSLESPKFWGPLWGGAGTDYTKQGIDKGAFAPDVLATVRNLGQPLKELEVTERRKRISYWVGIRIDPETGALSGAVSHDFNGMVEDGR